MAPLLPWAVLALAVPAQEPPPDPYTGGAAPAVAKAGYVALGAFPWAGGFRTEDVEEAVGLRDVLWLETEHFRIGSTLAAYKPLDSRERDKLRDELGRLRKRLPKVDPRAKILDPWLRLHLYAQRAEELFQELRAVLPEPAPGKYLLFFAQQAATCDRILERFGASATNCPTRYTFPQDGTLYLGIAAEHGSGALYKDSAMHVNLVFNLTANLVNGYQGYRFVVPIWISEGMALHAGRKLDPQCINFTQLGLDGPAQRLETAWEPYLHGWAQNGAFPPASDLTRWFDYEKRSFADHLHLWSRVDFLLSLGPERFGRFLAAFKSGVPADPAASATMPRLDQILRSHDRALQEVYGFDLTGFDQAWRDYARKRYARR